MLTKTVFVDCNGGKELIWQKVASSCLHFQCPDSKPVSAVLWCFKMLI